MRLLIVDDDPQAETLIEMALADARFHCVLDVVTTAAEGLRHILTNEHDVCLVDYRLPDRNGLDLINDAKAQGADRPFILMTGYGSGEIDEAALQAGAADYVEKHMVGASLERSIRYSLRDWRAEHALRAREEQLRQAQKMEAIGRLAGGIAHDFNNLLTAIVGYTDFALERLDPADPTAHDAGEIRIAADRAAALTRQLSAFSRKQFLQPVLLDLKETIGGMLKVLPRVIGEHITVTSDFDPVSSQIKVDAGQIEHMLLNLVLNVRDAMPGGGTLTLSTQHVDISRERVEAEGLVLPSGAYVMLTVADDGTGMDAETRNRAFEPFFTTKQKGKGTGLGLASAYGIVEQSGGAIAIDSGRGTGVRVYFPAATVPAPTKGTETILLVEDNDAVRDLARRTLVPHGYTVVEFRNGEHALDWIEQGHEPDLLVTDIVMPGLSGPNLAARVLRQHPRMRVLYISGYSGDDASAHGPLWVGVPLIQKPFSPVQLAERIRAVLDADIPDHDS